MEDKEIIILGDLNCDISSTKPVSHTKKLLSLIDNYQFVQLINEPTRITESTSTIIDLILTNQDQRIPRTGVIQIGISDHNLIYTVRKITLYKSGAHKYCTSRRFKHFNVNIFLRDLKSTDWSFLSPIRDINVRWQEWKNMFSGIIDKHAPLKTKRIKPLKNPWMTPLVRKQFILRDNLKKRFSKTNDPTIWNQFKEARNIANNMVRKAKSEYYHTKIEYSSNNPKETWNVINQLLNREQGDSTISHLTVNDKLISKPTEISNTFNKHFTEIGINLACQFPDNSQCFEHYMKSCNSANCCFDLKPTDIKLLDATTEWYINTDQRRLSSVIFIDLTKLFDTVDHSILIRKLELYGITGTALLWFKSYLSDRKQSCFVNGKLSTQRNWAQFLAHYYS